MGRVQRCVHCLVRTWCYESKTTTNAHREKLGKSKLTESQITKECYSDPVI